MDQGRHAPEGRTSGAMFRHPLAREVALVVALKTLIVISAGLLVFGPAQRPRITPGGVEDHILSPATPLTPRRFPP